MSGPVRTTTGRTATGRTTARDRLLAAADQLFYAEGVQTVGIDRIVEQAGVAKASLYNTFGSKEELIRAYLESRHARSADRIAAVLERYDTPRGRLLGIFGALAEQFGAETFHGCAFASASAEARPGSAADEVTGFHRAWVRGLFTDLAGQAGAREPELLARQLQLVYDGAVASARFDHDPSAATASRAAAAALLDAHIPP